MESIWQESYILRLPEGKHLQARWFFVLYIRAVSGLLTTITTTPQAQALESVLLGHCMWERKLWVTSSGTSNQLLVAGVWPHTATKIFEIADPDLRIEWHGAKGACTI